MSIDKLPPLEPNEDEYRLAAETFRSYAVTGQMVLDSYLRCRTRQLSEALDRIAALELERDALRFELEGVQEDFDNAADTVRYDRDYWFKRTKELKAQLAAATARGANRRTEGGVGGSS